MIDPDRPDDRPAQPAAAGHAAGPPQRLALARPYVTRLLVWTCVAVWVAAAAASGAGSWGELLVELPPLTLLMLGANQTRLVLDGEPWRLVAAMFLHAGLIHLFFNMFALYQLGRLLEPFYGHVRFLFLYVGSGLVGSVASCFHVAAFSVGASGAVFGLLGAAIGFSFKHHGELPHGLPRRLRWALAPWIALNLVLGFLVPRIDNLAHVGGLVGGFVLSLLVRASFADVWIPLEHRFARPRWMLVVSAVLIAYGVGGLLLGLGHADDELRQLQVVERMGLGGEESWQIRLLRVEALARAGETRDAAHELIAVIEDTELRDALRPETLASLPQILVASGDPGAAAAVYEALASVLDDNAYLLNNHAWYLLEQAPPEIRDAHRALRMARRAVALDDDNPYALGTLGTAHLRLGHGSDAVRFLQLAVQRHDRGAAATDLYFLAMAYAAVGEREGATRTFARALRLDPDNPYRREAALAVGMV